MKLPSLLCIPPALSATIYFAGDSTMAKGGGGSETDGWAEYISSSVTATVSNAAISGRSARSYTREGHFQSIADKLQTGDYVVIEFGHNDGGSLSSSDNGRTACPGTGEEACQTTYDGQSETVLTFPGYIANAAKLFRQKGAAVVVSSQTPNNVWESGKYSYTPSRFVEGAKIAAEAAGVEYVDHGAYVAARYKALGPETVDGFYPLDQGYTSPEGAQVVADTFLEGVVCKGVKLKHVLSTTDFDEECL